MYWKLVCYSVILFSLIWICTFAEDMIVRWWMKFLINQEFITFLIEHITRSSNYILSPLQELLSQTNSQNVKEHDIVNKQLMFDF